MKKFGVCIVGPGWVAGEYVKSFSKNPHTEMKAICSRSMESGKAKAAEWGIQVDVHTNYKEMIQRDDIHIVALCSPNNYHPEETILAADLGKHVVIEKPAALNLKDLRAMTNAVKKAGVKTITSFVLRWNPLIQIIDNLIKDDTIGKIYYGEVDYMHGVGPWYKLYQWMATKKMGGSSLLAAGCHALDALLGFMGADVVEVSSYSAMSESPDFKEYEYDATSVTILKFRDGRIGKVLSSVDCKMPYVFPITLLGSKGTIRNNKVFSHKYQGQTSWMDIPTILPDSGDVTHHPFDGEVNHFVDCIMNNKETITNIDWTYKVHEIILAADKSAEEGHAVKLPLP